MSNNRVLLAVVLVAAALLGLAYMLSRQPAPAVGGGSTRTTSRLFAFDPRDVTSLTVRRADGREETVRRSGAGRWVYSAAAPTRPVGEWPAAIPGTVTGALDALSSIEAPAAPQGSSVPEGAPSLTIRAGATTIALRISPEPLGGKTLVQPASGPAALLDSAVLDPFFNPGPSSWRIGSALPGVRDSSRVTVTTPSDALSLARAEGRWTLRRPISARAAEASVSKLFDALDQIAVTRFVDDARPDAAALGLDRPRLVIEAETDERIADGASGAPSDRVRRAALHVGAPASADGTLLYAAPDADASIVFVIPAAALGQISTASRSYIATTATGVLPSDVFALTIRHNEPRQFDRGYRRDLGQWRAMSGGRTTAQREPLDPSRVSELLEFLSSRPGEPEPIAELTTGTPPPPLMRSLAAIELANQEGDALDLLNIGYTPEGVLAVRSGGVLLTYPRVVPPSVLELPEFASLPPTPGALSVPTSSETPPIK